LSLKMATFSAFWALAHVAKEGSMAPPGPPWIRQWLCVIRYYADAEINRP